VGQPRQGNNVNEDWPQRGDLAAVFDGTVAHVVKHPARKVSERYTKPAEAFCKAKIYGPKPQGNLQICRTCSKRVGARKYLKESR